MVRNVTYQLKDLHTDKAIHRGASLLENVPSTSKSNNPYTLFMFLIVLWLFVLVNPVKLVVKTKTIRGKKRYEVISLFKILGLQIPSANTANRIKRCKKYVY